jgi:hypothetical protein
MIIDITPLEIGLIILSLPLLLALSYFYYNNKISKFKYCITIAIASLALTMITPENNLILNEEINLWYDKLLIFTIMNISIYIFIYNDSYKLIQNINYLTIAIGIFMVFILNSIGLFIGAISASIAANLLVSYPFTAKREIDNYLNKIFNLPLSFLITWMFMRIIGEEIWCLPIALSSYLIISFIFSIAYASFNFDKFWINNNYNISNYLSTKSIDCKGIINTQTRSSLFIIILSIGSIYTSNPIGFLMIILVFSIWNIYKTANWQEEDKSIKEMNKDFVNQLKENLTTTKSAINTITEKDDTKN